MDSHRPRQGGLPALGMLAVILCVLPASGQGMLDDIRIHGLVSQGYMRSTDNNYLADTENGSFEFSEAIVNFSTQVSERLRVGLQVLARDLGKEGNSIVGLDWAYGDYRWRRSLGLRFGKLKSHIGLYNKGRDVDMLRTSILLPQSVYEETTRDFAHSYNGFSVYGSPLVPGVGRLNYEVYAGTLPVRDPNSDFWRNNLRLVIDDLRPFFPQGVEPAIGFASLTVKYVAGGMLTWHTPLTGLRLCANFMKGDIDASARLEALVPVDTLQAASGLRLPLAGVWREELGIHIGIDRLLTVGAEYSWRDLLLAAELLSTKYDIELDLMTLTIPADAKWQGTYLMANYRVSDLLELGTYYAQFYPDKDDKGGQAMAAHGYNDFEAWREDIALSARFDVGENWLLKLEAHRMDGASQVMTHANPDGLDRDWYLFLAKISAHF